MKILNFSKDVNNCYSFNNGSDLQRYILNKYGMSDNELKVIYKKSTGFYIYLPGANYTINEYLIRSYCTILNYNNIKKLHEIIENFLMYSRS